MNVRTCFFIAQIKNNIKNNNNNNNKKTATQIHMKYSKIIKSHFSY